MNLNVGFVSTRFAGTDGVSLESAKWARVLESYGHRIFWYAGRIDREPAVSHCVPEAHFEHPETVWFEPRLWGHTERDPLVSERLRDAAAYLKATLYDFRRRFDLQVLIAENALTIPMHVPLGIALTEFLAETRMPAVAHHHDFYWERMRFSVNCISDYLDSVFPPRDPQIQHVVINQAAREELSWRRGLSSQLIPNVFDFERPPPEPDEFTQNVRQDLGFSDEDILILQPTRIVPRKGIEHAIQLVEQLGDPRCKLIISHEAGDEGFEYRHILAEMAHEAGVDLHFISTRISEMRHVTEEGKKVYTLWDLYPHVEFVTYPSLYEGFGNAFLEAVYFKLPILINRYAIFARDIEPKGFRVPTMEGYLTRHVLREVKRLLEDLDYRRQVVEHNYAVARRFFSYAELRRCLRMLITNITGTEDDA
ncbi:glycosyltransferase family 4 protein [Kiritimatiella glycovorans]|uniref:Glycosyltransferase group 1 n=1 Tax=Kiritimatiella glycovorans TaxID=1307763 RepID=A0A0G3EG03_9BACT|nr:glycosyltransferase family 4 protein [Kiritimatiella glycovorans]AKJ65361.1 Glycosyltransferase group 1 [Kiritimatiella glycovorans]